MISKFELFEEATPKGNIELYIKRPVQNPVRWKTVKPPSWLERLRGVTFEQKVIKAKEMMQIKCNKLNKKISDAERLASVQDINLSNPPHGGSGLPSKRPFPQPVRVGPPEEDRVECTWN